MSYFWADKEFLENRYEVLFGLGDPRLAFVRLFGVSGTALCFKSNCSSANSVSRFFFGEISVINFIFTSEVIESSLF